MLKSELVQKLAEKTPHLYHQDLERVVNIVLDEITETLKAGGRVELRGFGSFTTKSRDGRVGRNPRTGASVVVDPKRVPYFRASKELLERMNGPQPTSREPAGARG